MKLIITGFGSFLNNGTNPTKEVINKLPNKIDEVEVHPIELPVVFDECFNVLKPYIDKIKPNVIIMLGLAGNRTAITPERLAVNIKDSKSPDNLGNTPSDEIISLKGKNAYFSTLPLRKIEKVLYENSVPVSISNTAGLYVCNNIMYHVLHYIDTNNLDCKAGFIHVPFMGEDKPNDKSFSLPFEVIYESVINIIKAVNKKNA